MREMHPKRVEVGRRQEKTAPLEKNDLGLLRSFALILRYWAKIRSSITIIRRFICQNAHKSVLNAIQRESVCFAKFRS